ncbi:related to MRPL44-mitochondrial ribosomal protein, large subunit [Sporisorium reilianum SRZ2]|uniref:Related to MRPL44-mitochondrial ribosomal protein, large subunit n=1 Tax=Sporisorium reilianum (strain SRZ2) TaxID=999809 RepID=E6ZWS1_SPORE|nr:related to MRPL44-mitochondrial ribosomal protein, large subunit [Sporisorium reilianum SRZ2]
MSIAAASLKHITAMSFDFAPLSASQASRSMRLLLARLPTKPPMPGMDLPDIKTKTVATDAQQKIEITYKNKQKLVLDHLASEARLSDLVMKIEEPARALRLKEEGL